MRGKVIKTRRPGQPGTRRFRQRGLVAVRTYYDDERRMTYKTVERRVPGSERFHDRAAARAHREAMCPHLDSPQKQ